MQVIYLIVNPKGKFYVGQTNNLYNRLKSHKNSGKANKNYILYNSIKKYGWETHVVSVIEEVNELNHDEREIFWIKKLNSFCGNNKMGMNMNLGGRGNSATWKHNKERVEKASKRFSGERNPFYGKKCTEENKKIVGDKARERNLKQGRLIPKWGVDKMIELCSKKLVAYNLKGNFLGVYKSCNEAKVVLNAKEASAVALGKQNHSNGYIFRFYEENYPLQIDVSGMKFKRMSAPIYLLNSNREVTTEFNDAKEAAEKTGEPIGNITRGAKEQRRLRSGYFFMYKDDYEENISILNQVINN